MQIINGHKKTTRTCEWYLFLALIEAASPDLEKQGFLAVGFIYREYGG